MDEIAVRAAEFGDLPHILHHRRAMFEEMGHTDAAVLDRMESASAEYFRASLQNGSYLGWMAEAAGRVVGGGGIVLVSGPGSPVSPAPRGGWILNIYAERKFRRRGAARRIMQTIIDWCRS